MGRSGPAVAFLWHLHQPDYRDPRTGRPTMPWTRLHALRGYRDLLVESVEEGLAVTVNVVPVLLDQLLYYAGGGDDPHLELTIREADTLEEPEIDEIRSSFPCGHYAMSDAHPPWRRLRARMEAGHRPSIDELRDLQVWSTLAWFGATAARDFPEIGELWAKGSDFTEADKRVMLEVQARILRAIPDQLRALAQADGPELSTTPYYHPILPLVVDARHARRCLPGLPEVDFAWPEDALRQLTDARARMEEVLGVRPEGLWPSEGSVSPEVVELAGRAGFRWIATDEGVLARSDGERLGPGPGGWDLGHGVTGFFRDRDLSDRIGFHYARAEPGQAAAELLGLAKERAAEGVLLIALDGENPWESFRDAGAAFRTALYAGLRGPLRAITLGEASCLEPVGRIRRLHTGSWIHADFQIWIGHEDDRRAWKAVDLTRRAVEACEDPEARERALQHVLAAEGSDWTWWYGTEHSTPFARHFDELFRHHLLAAWEVLGEEPPPWFFEPIGRETSVETVPPDRPITPRLTARPAWIEWTGSGELRWAGGSMAVGVRHLSGIRFGWSADGSLWFRLDLAQPLPAEPEGTRWRLEVGSRSLELPYGERLEVDGDGITVVAGRGALVVRSDGGEQARFRVIRPASAGREGAESCVDYPTLGYFQLRPPDRRRAWWV